MLNLKEQTLLLRRMFFAKRTRYAEALNFPNCASTITKIRGGADQTRTDDPLHAMQVLYQLSYNPMSVNIFYISSCQMSNIFANLKPNLRRFLWIIKF